MDYNIYTTNYISLHIYYSLWFRRTCTLTCSLLFGDQSARMQVVCVSFKFILLFALVNFVLDFAFVDVPRSPDKVRGSASV